MSRPKFSPVELEPTGEFYSEGGLGAMGRVMPPDPKLKRPIGPWDNWKLMLQGKKPYWIPRSGWVGGDSVQLRPRIHPDNIANHQVMDGGPPFDYSGYGDAIPGLNGLVWHWVADVRGATMQPGNPVVPDINRWEEFIQFPNLDDWDWDSLEKQNKDYLGTDKMNQLGIQCGLWERLMAMCDVVEACIYMYDEDYKPGVHRFFDTYATWLIDYIGRVADRGRIDSVTIHEDWAHERAPFFSPDVAREMILPHQKRIIDYVHSRGMLYDIHCCGACEMLIPVFIESGADFWGGQHALNDMGRYAKEYKDTRFIFGVPAPDIGAEVPDDIAREAVKTWVDEYKDCRIAVGGMLRMEDMGKPRHPMISQYIYEYSRIAFQNED